MRKPIIAGNWKMNNTIADTKALITDLAPLVKDAACDVVICTPYTDLATAVEMTKGTNIHVGAENVHWAEKGAFTGEISAKMLVELGVEYVIIGHSERRQYFGETDQTVNARAKAALAAGLKPIICVGETLEERESGKVEEVLVRQTKGAFEGIDKEELDNIVIAYEPYGNRHRQDRNRRSRKRNDCNHPQHHGGTLLPQVRRKPRSYSIRRQHESQERQRTHGYA